MRNRTCRHAAGHLLPYLVNGSLEGSEADAARAHLDECADCTRDFEDLSAIAALLETHGLPVPADSRSAGRRPGGRRALFALAAALVVVAALGLVWTVRRGIPWPDGHEDPGGQEIVLDLGVGPQRGTGTLPALVPIAGARTARLTFFAPVDGGETPAAEIRGPGGVLVVPARPLPSPDDTGRFSLTAPLGGMTVPGTYELVVRRTLADGAVRSYRFPFEVTPGP